MDSTITVLFVAFEFPPLGSAGVQRSIKFAKYLPQFGVRPVVITVDGADYKNVMPGHPIDESLCNELSQDLIIERIHCPTPNYRQEGKLKKWARIFFSVVESFGKPWKDELTKKLPALIEKYRPEAIYVSLPPFAMGPLWAGLSKHAGIPLIVDFRDAWSQWCVTPNASVLHYRKKLRLEQRVLTQAKFVICSTAQIMKDMQRVHPNVPANKFHVIHNGYDLDLQFDRPLNLKAEKKLIIGYVGSFYYTPESRDRIFRPWYKRRLHRMMHYVPRKEDWLYRSPYFFFRALARLLNTNPELSGRVEIHFAGKTPEWLKQQISAFGLEAICRHAGFLNHEKVLEFQKNCDALLITSSKVPGGRDYSIAGKTYEYFTIGKPILGFVCEGEQKDILVQTGLALIFDPDDTERSAALLEKIFREEIQLSPNQPAIEKYHRKYLTSLLADLLRQIRPGN